MAFSDFNLRTALQTFGLTEQRDVDLFADVAPLNTSEFLRKWLDEFAPVAVGVNTEKARSEFIITPMHMAGNGVRDVISSHGRA